MSCETKHRHGATAQWLTFFGKAANSYRDRIGGGDQIYNDGIRVDGPLRPWTDIKNPRRRTKFAFPETLRRDCDDYYLKNYIRWYNTEPFASANGQIAQLNIWDDHDVSGLSSQTPRRMHILTPARSLTGLALTWTTS